MQNHLRGPFLTRFRLGVGAGLCSLGLLLTVGSFVAVPASIGEPIGAKETTAAGAWSIVPSPNPLAATNNYFTETTCISATDCWAVGRYDAGSADQTLIAHWDGVSWSIVSSPNATAAEDNALTSVACTSASNCWAVGYYEAEDALQTLILRWNGTTWSLVASPNTSITQENVLRSVTCASASACWAVGYFNAGSAYQTLIARWNGTAWSITTSPNTLALQTNILNDVTCTSATDCWAVGYYRSSLAVNQTLVQRWNGSSWSIVTSANTLPTEANILEGITCASAADCWAVGSSDTGGVLRTLTQRWNGILWSTVASPNATPTTNNVLSDVTCLSGSDCWAIGNFKNGTTPQTLIERWNGTAWTVVASPNTSGTENNTISSLHCVSPTECVAAGFYNSGGLNRTLVERWNGSAWTIVTTPNAVAKKSTTLSDVACVNDSDCWAVGRHSHNNLEQTLIQHWDGTSWTIADSPNTSAAQSNALYDITCTSAADCWAVGYHLSGIKAQTLIQHWDGSAWSIVASPNNSPTQHNILSSIACNSTTDCWAVGYHNVGTEYRTLTQHWDGAAWSIVPSPNASSPFTLLYGIDCTSANDCWAVGYYNSGGGSATLIEHWNGAAWSIVASPNAVGTAINVLGNIDCLSGTDCWAVGYQAFSDAPDQTLVQHWNGAAWSIVPSANTTTAMNNNLFGITCSSATDCWATGLAAVAGINQTMIQRWNGSAWSIVASPNSAPDESNSLASIACTTGDCWAVGTSYANNLGQTLVQRFTLPSIPLLGVVSRKTHGAAGIFDIELPATGNVGIECRSGGGANAHQLVASFATSVTFTSAAVTSGTATVNAATGSGTNAITIDLTAVANAQTVTITLFGVNDGAATGDIPIRMGVLLGDTTSNRTVNSSDIGATKAQSGSAASAANFRTDVTVNGTINSSDIGTVKASSGTSLP